MAEQQITGQAFMSQLNETIASKEIALEAKKSLEEQYAAISSDNNDLKTKNLRLEENLSLLKSDFDEQKSKFEILMSRFTSVQNGLIKAQEELSKMRFRVRKLCSKIQEYGLDDTECN